MRRLLVILLLAAGLVPVVGGTAWACSCASYGDGSDEAEYRGLARDMKVIYTGLVTAQERSPEPAPGSPPQPIGEVRYTVRVDEDLKGGASGTRVVSTSGGGGASCGIELAPGRRALVLEPTGDRRTGLCDGTTQERVDARAAIVRDELRGPTLADTGAPPSWAAGALLLLAAAVGARHVGSRSWSRLS